MDAAPEIPPAPRQLTPRARRRAWGDHRVRFWWFSAVVVAGIAVYFTGYFAAEARRDRKLVEHGTLIKARIVSADNSARPRLIQRGNEEVVLSGVMPDGREWSERGYLTPPGFAEVGGEIEVRVDPNDPKRWTDRTEPRPLGVELVTSWIMLLPLAAVFLGIAWWRRRQVLEVWRDGVPSEGVVVELKHSAMAPLSRVIRFTMVGGRDKRVFAALHPPDGRIPAVGEPIVLLALPKAPQRAIVAHAYAGGPGAPGSVHG